MEGFYLHQMTALESKLASGSLVSLRRHRFLGATPVPPEMRSPLASASDGSLPPRSRSGSVPHRALPSHSRKSVDLLLKSIYTHFAGRLSTMKHRKPKNARGKHYAPRRRKLPGLLLGTASVAAIGTAAATLGPTMMTTPTPSPSASLGDPMLKSRTTSPATNKSQISSKPTKKVTPPSKPTPRPTASTSPPRPKPSRTSQTPVPKPPKPSRPSSTVASTPPAPAVSPAAPSATQSSQKTRWYTSRAAVAAAQVMAASGTIRGDLCSLASYGPPAPALIPTDVTAIGVGIIGNYYCYMW